MPYDLQLQNEEYEGLVATSVIDELRRGEDVEEAAAELRQPYSGLLSAAAPVFRPAMHLTAVYLPYEEYVTFSNVTEETEERSNTVPDSITANWQRLASSGASLEMFIRILDLAMKPDGWRGVGSRELIGGSVRTFLKFWDAVRNNSVEPFITLSPTGNLHCEWHASWRRHLDVEFVEDGTAFFGLFHNRTVIEGRDNVDSLREMLLLRTPNPLMWG